MPPDDGNPYAGRWVARINGQIVAQGGTPQQAMQAAKHARPKEKAEVSFMPASPNLAFPEIVHRLRPHLPEGQELYLVGGAVRDMLLGRQIKDFDFALPAPAIPLARRLADELDGAFFPLDKEHDVGRVLLDEDLGRITLDFTALRGSSLENDLAARDFTINAIAMDVHKEGELLDPLGGTQDLLARKLKACSASSIPDDPLRILRAIRMAATFKLKIEESTRESMRRHAQELEQVSAERVRDELLRLMLAPRPATSLRALDILGALDPVLPELAAVKGIEQPGQHRYNVFEHILRVVESLGLVLDALAEEYPEEGARELNSSLIVLQLGRYRQQVSQRLRREFVAERPLKALLYLAAAHHDVGKQPEQTAGGGDQRFIDHELLARALMAKRAAALRFSNEEQKWLTDMVGLHREMAKLTLEAEITRRMIYRFFHKTGEVGVELCLLSVADVMGKYGPELPREKLEERLAVARTLLEAHFEHYEEFIDPPALLDGDDLINEFKLRPGPRVGELLAAIREEQAAGEIGTREEALAFVRKTAAL